MDNSKKLPSNKREKVVAPNLKKQNLFETICSYGITILCFIFFGYVAIMSVLQTSEFDSANFGGEVIQFNYDDLVMNFFLLGGFFLLVFALSRYANVFKKVSDLALVVGLSVYTITLGFIWIPSITMLVTTRFIHSNLVLCLSVKLFTEFSVQQLQCQCRYLMYWL